MWATGKGLEDDLESRALINGIKSSAFANRPPLKSGSYPPTESRR